MSERKPLADSPVVIGHYKLTSEFVFAGGGTARWAYALDMHTRARIFIKEFLSPVYPDTLIELPARIFESKVRQCKEFFDHKTKLYGELNRVNRGNLVVPFNIFKERNRFYAVSLAVRHDQMTPLEVAGLAEAKKRALLKSLVYSMVQLENAGIVHADIKMDNVLIKRTVGENYAIKLIDFDAGFFAVSPPSPDELQGDLVYMAPEAVEYMHEETDTLTSKLDVFSLGVLAHQIFSGETPIATDGKSKYPHEAVLRGSSLKLNQKISYDIREIIALMLRLNPQERPSFQDVMRYLIQVDRRDARETVADGAKPGKSERTLEPSIPPAPPAEAVSAYVRIKMGTRAAHEAPTGSGLGRAGDGTGGGE